MASNHHGCKDLLAVIPIWHYVIQLILYNPVVCLSCTQFDLTPPPNSLTIARFSTLLSPSIHRDSIVLRRNSKRKGQEKIATLHSLSGVVRLRYSLDLVLTVTSKYNRIPLY